MHAYKCFLFSSDTSDQIRKKEPNVAEVMNGVTVKMRHPNINAVKIPGIPKLFEGGFTLVA